MTIDEALTEYLLLFGAAPLDEKYMDGEWLPGEEDWLTELIHESWVTRDYDSLDHRRVWTTLRRYYRSYTQSL